MTSELGSYLKARRAQITPADVGLEAGSARRVPGLRREEVALLAGVSVDYYARLEQGRERNPSPSVLNALANALGLDDHQREYLFRIAGLTPTPRTAATPAPSLQGMLDTWPQTPAMVLNRRLDVVSHNALAAALYSDFESLDNLARMTFLDPAAQHFYLAPDAVAAAVVAQLRLALSFVDATEDVRRLVIDLCGASTRFGDLWARYDVRGKTHATKTFHHSSVGELALEVHAFDVKAGPPGHQLIVYHAAPTSPSAEKLQLLASLQATASNPP